MSKYAVSKMCPQCNGSEFSRKRAETFVAFASDRVCKSCGTRYTPPTPIWAAITFVLAGLLLSVFGAYALYTRIKSGNPLGIPAMLIEGGLGFLGLLAIAQGVRALIKPGKV